MLDLLIPGMTFVAGLAGGFAGAQGAQMVLRSQMGDARDRLNVLGKRVHDHNDELLIQDAELASVMVKLGLPRLPRRLRKE